MASREKKVSLGRKQATASPIPAIEASNAFSLTKSETQSDETQQKPVQTLRQQTNKKLALKKKVAKKVIKKSFKIKLKSNKVNKRHNNKTILGKSKAAELKGLKNGVKKTKVLRKKLQPIVEVKIEPEDDDDEEEPPILEPIQPIEESIDKKPKKKGLIKKIDTETTCTITDTIESIVNQTNIKQVKKGRVMKKPKETSVEVIEESIDDIMNDLSCLIDTENVKKDGNDTESESSKGKKVIGKKIDLLKKKEKKIAENDLTKIDTSDSKIIDMLDLNVSNIKNKTVKRRRHSIEKFPITNADVTIQDMTIFSNLPRSISPKNKRTLRIRQSIDSNKRSSPYTTRSDSPARILRNGKHRKLIHMNLLDGIDSEYKKRRRLCSDFSGSELSVSKLSGYESDSSFSDMASLHGAENVDQTDTTPKELLIKKELMETLENNPDAVDANNIPESLSAIIKRSLSTDATNKTIDTNSNLCTDVITTVQIKDECIFSEEFIHPSSKLPEKGLLLGIMKQAFNVIEDPQEKEKRKTRSSARKIKSTEEVEVAGMSTSKFYGPPIVSNEIVSNKSEIDAEIEPPILTPITPQIIENKDVYTFDEEKPIEDDKQPINEELAELTDETKLDDTPPIIEETAQKDEIIQTILSTVDETVVTEIINTLIAQEDIIEAKLDNIEHEDVNESETNISVESNQSEIVESAEDLAVKNQILKALGLQSLQAAEEAKLRKQVPKTDSYTGTLKTVIKLQRLNKTKGRNPIKMTLQKKGKSAAHAGGKDDDLVRMEEDEYKIMKEGSSSWKAAQPGGAAGGGGGQSSDTAGAPRKSHYSNRSNMDGSSEHTSDGDTNVTEDGAGKLLVIPEKASSFSIHPGRLCKDECSYCFGKFGLFDTPCHIAQMKSVDRQNKVLAAEKHLTHDSCLCDACYRHVDRKSNAPSYTANRSYKRALVAPGPRQNHCHVLGCGRLATNILRRKWLMKMRKSVCQVINIDLDNPGLHSIPICEDHYASLEHLMVCAMCKRRLARNHIHYLGPESNDLNGALNELGIPVKLNDKPVVCKLCKYFATIILKNVADRTEHCNNFLIEYRKRLLHFHEVEVMDDDLVEEPIHMPEKNKEQLKKKKKLKNQTNLDPPILEPQVDIETLEEPNSRVPSTESRPESPSDYMVDYNTLIPNIAIDCGTADIELTRKELSKKSAVSIKRIMKSNDLIIKESSKLKLNKNKSDMAVQRLGSNPSISVRQLFAGEEDLPLNGSIDFQNVKERTPEGWEKCSTTIQYDPDTKLLWNELQKPYGNQSSFLRHLILLEKYFRNGDLILSSSASHHSINYTESVQNRLRAYDNIPASASTVQPLSMIPFNKQHRSHSGIITSKEPPSPLKTTTTPHKLTPKKLEPIPQLEKPKLKTPLNLPQLNPLPPQLTVSHSTQLTNVSSQPILSQANPITPQISISQSSQISINPISQILTTPQLIQTPLMSHSAQIHSNQMSHATQMSQINQANIPKNTPITMSLLTSNNFIVPNPAATNNAPALTSIHAKPKLPPGLISLQPGTKIPVTPLVKVPPQKIKFPITKNWRPNLIPIDPNKKPEKKPGLVQVSSGGKPYHITLEDYKKMFAIKRTFELRQKRMLETQRNHSILKQMSPRKGLSISKSTLASQSSSPTKTDSNSDDAQEMDSLEKLDKTVEKLEAHLNNDKSLKMPKIPKSLTVIPQTIGAKKSSRPSSPTLVITPKNKTTGKS